MSTAGNASLDTCTPEDTSAAARGKDCRGAVWKLKAKTKAEGMKLIRVIDKWLKCSFLLFHGVAVRMQAKPKHQQLNCMNY